MLYDDVLIHTACAKCLSRLARICLWGILLIVFNVNIWEMAELIRQKEMFLDLDLTDYNRSYVIS